MAQYLAKCTECEREFRLGITNNIELKMWDNKTLEVRCPHCNRIIKPAAVVMGSPLHHVRTEPTKRKNDVQ